jgi:hypothetical protein
MNVFDEDETTRNAVDMANRAVRIGLASKRIESWHAECNEVLIFYKFEIYKKFTIRRKQSRKDAVLVGKLNKCLDLLRVLKQK